MFKGELYLHVCMATCVAVRDWMLVGRFDCCVISTGFIRSTMRLRVSERFNTKCGNTISRCTVPVIRKWIQRNGIMS